MKLLNNNEMNLFNVNPLVITKCKCFILLVKLEYKDVDDLSLLSLT